MTNKKNGTLYTGVTSDLVKRTYDHKNGITDGFTSRYDCKTLVFYELQDTMESAITREKKIKVGSRTKKIELIEGVIQHGKICIMIFLARFFPGLPRLRLAMTGVVDE